MNTSKLLHIRLHNQMLSTHRFNAPAEIVAWMGAMQSQALEMAKWAIGVRLENSLVKDVEGALNRGEIIRTHILRPTWHFVSAEDIHWMFDLSNARIKPIYQSPVRMARGNVSLIKRATQVMEKVLEGGKHLTKEEIGLELQAFGLTLDNTSLGLAINFVEMEGVLVNGKLRGSKQTFTLLGEWAPRKVTLSKEEALERLTRKYFTSHGPATVHDFMWWSGLSLTECRVGIEAIKSDFICENVNGRELWMKHGIQVPLAGKHSALLLAPFDEFVVSYKDRSEIVEAEHQGKVMTKNGIFSPTVMLDGKIIGAWKKNSGQNTPKIELSFFEKKSEQMRELFDHPIQQVEAFYSK